MSAHTPGPWKIYDQDSPTPHIGTVATSDRGWDYKVVCSLNEDVTPEDSVVGKWYEPYDNALANARLICAAPDLLDALLTMLGEHDDYNYMTASMRRAKARAAIFKAIGKTE